MRYFFHAVQGGSVYEDSKGREFAKKENAMAHAAVIARELAEDGSFAGFAIQVIDERQNEIGRVSIGAGPSIH